MGSAQRRTLIEICTTEVKEFWITLLQLKPSIDKLEYYGKKIRKRLLDLKKLYCNIKSTRNNISFLYNYGLFLKNIVHDDIEVYFIANKIDNYRKISVRSINDWNCWTSKNALLRVSGDWKTLCTIKELNSEFEKISGYSKNQILNTNCNKLMLPIMRKCHETWLSSICESPKKILLNKQFPFFLLKKNGYYTQCEILIIPAPKFDIQSMEFALFIRHRDRKSVV